jgi:pimeloyl-ACP methyl ester carboxylesterase
MATITLGAITVGFDDLGDGEPVVFVHGHPFDRSMWRPQLETFSDRHRVVAADLRGYGQSSIVPGTTTLGTFADDIAALLDHLAIDRAVLCGLSMGGQIVMEFVGHFPHRVRGLVLADTSAAAETAEGMAIRYELADRLLRDGREAYADEMLPKMVAPANIVAMPAVAKHVSTMMRDTSPVGAAAALRGRAERPDYRDLLSSLPTPTLVVVGAEDEFTPVDVARAMHDRMPDATLAIIPGAGHLPNLERTEEFDSVLRGFLDGLPPAGEG